MSVESFSVCAVAPLHRPGFATRWDALARAENEVARLRAEDMVLDLVIDSGVSALSETQLSMFNRYAHAVNGAPYDELAAFVQDQFGFPHVLPIVKARAAENVLFWQLLTEGRDETPIVLGNGFFDTTVHNIAHSGGEAIDAGVHGQRPPTVSAPCRGNFDLIRVKALLDEHGPRVRGFCVTTTITAGGHPIDIDNLRAVRALADERGLWVVMDACRFAEHAALARQQVPALADRALPDVVRAYFDLADVVYISAAKDAMSPTGAVLLVREPALHQQLAGKIHLQYGYKYTGGLPLMMLAVMTQGMREALDERWQAQRIAQVDQFAQWLAGAGLTPWRPSGGHAVFVSSDALRGAVRWDRFVNEAFLNTLYLVGGVRAGGFYQGRGTARYVQELEAGTLDDKVLAEHMAVRLCVPRRRVTTMQLWYVTQAVAQARHAMQAHPGFVVRGTNPLGELVLDFAPGGDVEAYRAAVEERARVVDAMMA